MVSPQIRVRSNISWPDLLSTGREQEACKAPKLQEVMQAPWNQGRWNLNVMVGAPGGWLCAMNRREASVQSEEAFQNEESLGYFSNEEMQVKHM